MARARPERGGKRSTAAKATDDALRQAADKARSRLQKRKSEKKPGKTPSASEWVGAAQRADDQVDRLVAAAADQQLIRLYAIDLGQPRAQGIRLRLRVTAQRAFGIGTVIPGRFVGVQPNRAAHFFGARRTITGERALRRRGFELDVEDV